MKPDIKSIIKTGVNIGSVLTGGKTKSILDIVNNGILNEKDVYNAEPLREIAESNDAQNEVLVNHEQRLRAIEVKLGLR